MSRYVLVFPARAGMSPVALRAATYTAGFPRTRGDEPKIIQGLIDGIKFSPHARG